MWIAIFEAAHYKLAYVAYVSLPAISPTAISRLLRRR